MCEINILMSSTSSDATENMKSPPKDVKTNKNLQMRLKVQEPAQSLYRTDALSPTWMMGCKEVFYLTNLVCLMSSLQCFVCR